MINDMEVFCYRNNLKGDVYYPLLLIIFIIRYCINGFFNGDLAVTKIGNLAVKIRKEFIIQRNCKQA